MLAMPCWLSQLGACHDAAAPRGGQGAPGFGGPVSKMTLAILSYP